MVLNDQTKTILAVLAHPDDETFGMGGTLALYAHRGYQVHLICATRGEVGEVDEHYLQGFNTIAERRECELRCAAEHLALAGVHFLDYRDSGMPGSSDNDHPQALINAPLDDVAAQVVHFIRLLKPQIVLTFDPIGGYRHPDHIHIHQVTVKAFFAAADSKQFNDLPAHTPDRLFFHVIPHTALKILVRLMPLVGKDPRRFGRNGDIDLASIAEVDFPTHAIIDYHTVASERDQASACHASQGGKEMNKGPMGWLRRLFGARESFMQAYPEPAVGKKIHDLFEGIA